MTQASIRQILELPVRERIRLVQRVLDSIARDEDQFALTKEEEAELERRVKAHRKNPSAAIPLDKVLSEMSRKRR